MYVLSVCVSAHVCVCVRMCVFVVCGMHVCTCVYVWCVHVSV